MNKVSGMDASDRAEIFSVSASKLGMSASAVEKDFWVCRALQKIFEHEELARLVLFKGGTSLSKCFGLIQRFSEDIDLILDWNELTDEDPYAGRSNRQQDIFNKKMESRAGEYVKNRLFPLVTSIMGEHCTVALSPDKPKSLLMSYPRAFDSPYLKPQIELEFSPMSAMIPNGEFTISPYCATILPDQFEAPGIAVKSIAARKTFWDKVSILHVEAHRPEEKPQPPRYSRHYYDLFQMLNSPVKDDAMKDSGLLQEIIRFKAKFYPQGWANYEAAAQGKFKLFPEAHTLKTLGTDYAQMQEMIFGDYPAFAEIVEAIKQFQYELNSP